MYVVGTWYKHQLWHKGLKVWTILINWCTLNRVNYRMGICVRKVEHSENWAYHLLTFRTWVLRRSGVEWNLISMDTFITPCIVSVDQGPRQNKGSRAPWAEPIILRVQCRQDNDVFRRNNDIFSTKKRFIQIIEFKRLGGYKLFPLFHPWPSWEISSQKVHCLLQGNYSLCPG